MISGSFFYPFPQGLKIHSMHWGHPPCYLRKAHRAHQRSQELTPKMSGQADLPGGSVWGERRRNRAMGSAEVLNEAEPEEDSSPAGLLS